MPGACSPPGGSLVIRCRLDYPQRKMQVQIARVAQKVIDALGRLKPMCCKVGSTEFDLKLWISMTRWAGPLLACALGLGNAHANAQAGATPPTPDHKESGQPAAPSGQQALSAQPRPSERPGQPGSLAWRSATYSAGIRPRCSFEPP